MMWKKQINPKEEVNLYFDFDMYFKLEVPVNMIETKTEILNRLKQFIINRSQIITSTKGKYINKKKNVLIVWNMEQGGKVKIKPYIIKEGEYSWLNKFITNPSYIMYTIVCTIATDTPDIIHKLTSEAIWKDFKEEEIIREQNEIKALKILKSEGNN